MFASASEAVRVTLGLPQQGFRGSLPQKAVTVLLGCGSKVRCCEVPVDGVRKIPAWTVFLSTVLASRRPRVPLGLELLLQQCGTPSEGSGRRLERQADLEFETRADQQDRRELAGSQDPARE
jgi:hypothetical protein